MDDGVARYTPPARIAEASRAIASVSSDAPRSRSPLLKLNGVIERVFVSETGYVLVMGWLADEGSGPLAFKIRGAGLDLSLAPDSVQRYARPDIENALRPGAFDYGFLAFGKAAAPNALKTSLDIDIRSADSALTIAVAPEVVSDRRLLDLWLIAAAGVQSHGGSAFGLHRCVAGDAGAAAVALFQSHVAGHVARRHVHRFRARPVERSFVTVLFGTTEPIKLQPILFRQQGIDAGEWIYVCNSPEDAEAVMRLGRMVSDLYDLMITVIVMPDNVGFGAANNAAVAEAASETIYLLNPDVYPVPGHAAALHATLERRALGAGLWGGLLFYDDQNLMHSGLYLDRDTAFHRETLGSTSRPGEGAAIDLLRVEHFDKGVPFEEARWRRPKQVPAVTGCRDGVCAPGLRAARRLLDPLHLRPLRGRRPVAALGRGGRSSWRSTPCCGSSTSRDTGRSQRASSSAPPPSSTAISSRCSTVTAFARDPGAFTAASEVAHATVRDIAADRP